MSRQGWQKVRPSGNDPEWRKTTSPSRCPVCHGSGNSSKPQVVLNNEQRKAHAKYGEFTLPDKECYFIVNDEVVAQKMIGREPFYILLKAYQFGDVYTVQSRKMEFP